MQGTAIRWLRRAAGAFAGCLLAGSVLMPVTGAYAAEPARHGARTGSSPLPGPYAAEPSPHGSLAGSRAGVGRTPPGRPLRPVTDFDEPVLPPPPPPAEPSAATPTAPPSQQPAADRPAADRPTTAARDTEPLVNVVPLGAGLLLLGLGIGFLALRLRR